MDATKMVLVTDANRGPGLEAGRELAVMWCRILLDCRDLRIRELIDW